MNEQPSHLADLFWQRVPAELRRDRDLASAILWVLPIAIVHLPGLGIDSVRRWLRDRGIPGLFPHADRRLRACLVASKGRGLVFLDGTDSTAERLFSLAHEVSHFLVDYLAPREAAIEHFGESVRAVLDGDRAPTVAERLSGVLRGVPLDTLAHLMDRGCAQYARRADVIAREDRADLLALQLLAPEGDVVQMLERNGINWLHPQAVDSVISILSQNYGLPLAEAERYARYIAGQRRVPQSFRHWLSGGASAT